MSIDLSKHLGNSGYLKALDIDNTDDEEMVLTIVDVNEVYSESLSKDQIEVSFNEIEKKLTLNVTNTKKLVEMYGMDDEEWIGKKIRLYSDDSKTPQGAPCRTIKIKPFKKKVTEAVAAPFKKKVAEAVAAPVKSAKEPLGAGMGTRGKVFLKEENSDSDPFAED